MEMRSSLQSCSAKSMHGLTDLPQTSKLLKAGARVCRPGSLMFLLLGAQNYQICPKGVKRIGWMYCLSSWKHLLWLNTF